MDIFSIFLEGPDKQETHINMAGADFGHKLKEMIKDRSWKKSLPKTTNKDYMDLTEFK